MKQNFNLLFLTLLLFCCLSASTLLTANNGHKSNRVAIDHFLDCDGTLNIPSGFSGTLDLSGFSVQLDECEGIVATPSATPLMMNAWQPLGDGLLKGNPAQFQGICYTIAVAPDGTVYAGGEFDTAGGNSANNIAKWDGTTWSALGSGLTNGGFSNCSDILIVSNNSIYVCGNFDFAGGNSAKHVAHWDGSNWSALGSGLNSRAYTLAMSNGILYVGGLFTQAGGNTAGRIAQWDGTNWSPVGTTGFPVTGFGPACNAIVFDSNGDLYAGGKFASVDGTTVNNVAKWDGSSWSDVGGGIDIFQFGTGVADLAVDGTILYACGNFSNNNVQQWDGTSWSDVGSAFSGVCQGMVVDQDGTLYVTGNFTAPSTRIAKWDGVSWTGVGNGFNAAGGQDLAIAPDGTLYAGGGFTMSGDTEMRKIAFFGELPPMCDIEITSVDVSDETCAGDNDGSITINATCTTCDGILYSIDGGMTTQSSPTFTGLSPDTYQPFVVDSGDNTCDDTDMDAAVNMGAPLPADPVAVQMSSEFCSNSGVGNGEKRVRIEEPAGANEGTIWTLTDAPTGSQFDGMEPIEFAEGDSNSEFRVTGGSKGNTVTMRGEPDNNGTPVYGTWTFDVRVEDSNTGCTSGTETGYFITAFENPADPVAEIATKSLCVNPDLAPSLANSGVKVMNDLTADERVVWVLTSAPAGSAFAANDEFTIDNCGDPFKNYGELAVAFSSKVIRIQDIENAPVGTYSFDAYIENCATGCISESTTGFSITVNAAPSVMITADLPIGIGRDLCLGQEDVQYNAVVTSTDGGTYSYLWCAYNSGDGSGTCFNGFDNNTAEMPTRDWTTSGGSKSVGVTVTSDTPGCEAEDLYSFEVIAPTMIECPDDIMATLETDPMTFDCSTDITFNHPMIMAGPCDPINLTIEITGPSGAGPEMVTPGEEYVFTVEELGIYTATYNLTDGVGNTSSCSFDIMVDGLLCGWVDNGGIGDCSGENSSVYDPESEAFSVSSNGCVPEFPYTGDNQAFINTQLCGDGYIEVFVDNITAKGFAGISLRESQAAGAKKVEIGTDNVARIIRAARVIDGYPAFPQELISFDKFWLKIERTGNVFRASASTDGITYTPYLFQSIMMGECLEAGLWAYSTNPEDVVTANFTNVTVEEYGGDNLQAPVTNLAQSQTDLGAFDVSLTPNPAQEQVSINMEQLIGQEVSIRLYNINGQLMQQQQLQAVEAATHRIDLSYLPKGAYWVQVQSVSEQKTLKLIKQ